MNLNDAKEITINELIKCQENDDTEMAHYEADDVLCDFLIELGHSDVVEQFKKVKKWYA
jgi:hypothetical protein